MDKKYYYKNSITRRVLVQIIYQNEHFLNTDIYSYLEDQNFAQSILNRDLFCLVLAKIFELWNHYDDLISSIDLDLCLIAKISKSVLKACIAEILLDPINYKLYINEYIKLAKIFNENDAKIINKFLDLFYKTIDSSKKM